MQLTLEGHGGADDARSASNSTLDGFVDDRRSAAADAARGNARSR